MFEATDYYRLLEIDDSASAEAIKQAYRKLALAYHPDRNPGDTAAEERFKGVQTAYEVLADPVRKAAYDRARQSAFVRSSLFGAFENVTRDSMTSGFGGSAGGTTSPADAADDPIFGFFFDQGRPLPRGDDVETQLQLTFDQALRGGMTDLPVHEAEAVRLVIPRGVRTGVRIRVPGRGLHAEGGQPGDLFVTLRVDASPRFRREGDHLHIGETVSAIEAILGTSRSITNAYGQTIKVTIPAGTQPGERLRLRGQGVVTDKRAGDLFVEVLMTVPRELSDAQRAELERAAQAAGLL